ncbi:right-handed parallel beta-helix repeat-containing protein [Flavobacterium terrisoli]|uniref:right-handed parallel beta-helix repeat-containing protein n=1 Tax=Flavobacterium terrisoli TaxID=3242195 RepID=UPI002542DF57|nr:right-handed parallel beta-helix repeat-containing protein [Flavobacterium buctense]
MKKYKISTKKQQSLSAYCVVLMLFISSYSSAKEWFASPNGKAVNTKALGGTVTNPFNLNAALNLTDVILPGDILWLKGGRYTGRFVSKLSGKAIAKITIASWPGEWAILDGNILNTKSSNSNNNQVLKVLGGNVIFKDFEVTYSKVIRSDTTPNYALCGGIEHTSGEDCEFINLIIHDNPGKGMGSWKEVGGTFVYGCIIYNNGYLTPRKDKRGHGPGLYVQNESDKYRVFKNNIVFNNFHDGFQCYSTGKAPVKNITLDDNTVFNNGSPHHSAASPGDNNINVSNGSSNGESVIHNINIINNTLYHNTNYTQKESGGEACSLLIGNEFPQSCPPNLKDPGIGSHHIIVKNNFISGRNNFINFKNINQIVFQNNMALGRFIIVDERNKLTGKINPTNWQFSDNIYFTRNGSFCKPPNIHPIFRMEHQNYSFNGTVCKPVGQKVITDYYIYNHPKETFSKPFDPQFISWAETFGIDSNSHSRFFLLANNPIRTKSANGPWLDNPPNVLKITKNTYKPNQYKLVLLSPPNDNGWGGDNEKPLINPMVTVNFGDHGINIPDGTHYILKDIENLSNPKPVSGRISNNQLIINLGTAGFDTPKGKLTDFKNQAEKTPNCFGVFLVEFKK